MPTMSDYYEYAKLAAAAYVDLANVPQTNSQYEKVLALRGTELWEDGGVDLLGADVGQIGILGIALTQVVSMVNLTCNAINNN